MNLPNLFTHARSELAQDAVLAYVLEWAAPEHRTTDPEMNALGEALLRALFTASSAALDEPAWKETDPLTEVTVSTQTRNIDILVRVNGVFALVIEDKVDAHERPGQIERYRTLLANTPSPSGTAWVIHAVYVKTGNESPHRRPAIGTCGVLMRSELLAILDRFPNVDNQIVREFRDHLHSIHAETESFRMLPPNHWPPRAVQGFYMAITDWLTDRHAAGELSQNPGPQWNYQANPQGGEFVCSWCWTNLDGTGSLLWLQLHDANSLQLRMANHQQDTGKPKVEPRQLHAMLQRLTRAAASEPWKGRLWVRKAGKFGGGDTAAVAKLTFDPTAENWLPRNSQGLLDWPEACRRLTLAMQFLDSARIAEEPAR